ncbi:MAG TPA: von Willebrand factor type A domain-containing protein [Saprospiraceae bacterium]|nr:von Willebrand factor type A domain-containing protein [Saprospiraceae bacterium]
MITVVNKLILLVSLLWISDINVENNSPTTISGKVTDAAEKDAPLIFATVLLYRDGKLITGTETDLDGNFMIADVQPGTYDFEASYVGFATQKIQGVVVKAGRNNVVNFSLSSDQIILSGIEVKAFRIPLIEFDNTTQGSTVTAEKIRNLPTKNVNEIAARSAGISSRDGGDISIRGSRSNETVYFLDGVRVTGNLIPQSEIQGKKGKENNKTNKDQEVKIIEPAPEPEINTESYDAIVENRFVSPLDEALSTFSLDVDKAAYANVRRFINNGEKPPVDAVRIEEMINYFEYSYPAPKGDDIIAVSTTYTDCPWNEDMQLLHLGLQSKKIDFKDLPNSNIVFLIDVSGSMDEPNKLPLVISSFKLLLDQLRPEDRVAIVTYAGSAGVALPSTPASEKQKIIEGLERLSAGGSTAGAEGIVTAYEIAVQNFIKNGNNRVVLATDGDFNVGISDNKSLETLIEEKRKTGVFLSVLGFGMGNYKDSKMQILADKGNGNHAYIDDIQEAGKVLVSEFGGTMYTLAKDVKFQIEFNPDAVQYYRLVGYENRMLAKEDFNDDTKDAGELGMGHQMTAIYEIITKGKEADKKSNVDELKYQKISKSNENQPFANELGTIKFRYKAPDSDVSKKWEQVISTDTQKISKSNSDVQFSTAVAFAGLLLRNSGSVQDKDYEDMIELADNARGKDKDGYRAEFIRLMKTTKALHSKGLSAVGN